MNGTSSEEVADSLYNDLGDLEDLGRQFSDQGRQFVNPSVLEEMEQVLLRALACVRELLARG